MGRNDMPISKFYEKNPDLFYPLNLFRMTKVAVKTLNSIKNPCKNLLSLRELNNLGCNKQVHLKIDEFLDTFPTCGDIEQDASFWTELPVLCGNELAPKDETFEKPNLEVPKPLSRETFMELHKKVMKFCFEYGFSGSDPSYVVREALPLLEGETKSRVNVAINSDNRVFRIVTNEEKLAAILAADAISETETSADVENPITNSEEKREQNWVPSLGYLDPEHCIEWKDHMNDEEVMKFISNMVQNFDHEEELDLISESSDEEGILGHSIKDNEIEFEINNGKFEEAPGYIPIEEMEAYFPKLIVNDKNEEETKIIREEIGKISKNGASSEDLEKEIDALPHLIEMIRLKQ